MPEVAGEGQQAQRGIYQQTEHEERAECAVIVEGIPDSETRVQKT